MVALNDGGEQAQFVAQRILELRDEGIELNEIAVLYRAHYHAVELQLELSRRGIPYQITSGIRFFEQAHIKDVAAFIRFVANPRDEVAFKRMVRLLPGIGGKSAENLWRAWEESLDKSDGHRLLERAAALPMSVGARAKKIVGTTGAHAGRNRAGRDTEAADGDDHVDRGSDLRRLRESEFHQLRTAPGRSESARGVRPPVQGRARIPLAARA